jgi:hypothetical protein
MEHMRRGGALKLPEELRPSLQRPLGPLLKNVKDVLKCVKKKPPALITVGDRVTAEFLLAGVEPDLAIVDMKVMRSPIGEKVKIAIESFKAKTIRVKNPAGTITPELVKAIELAYPPTKIIVGGEEDLATLPAVLSAPLGSVVVYGQPKQGMVMVKVTRAKRREFSKIMKKFVRV